jgi:hypothetical protein
MQPPPLILSAPFAIFLPMAQRIRKKAYLCSRKSYQGMKFLLLFLSLFLQLNMSGYANPIPQGNRTPDAIGNLFETRDRTDRKYGKGVRFIAYFC